MEDFVEDLRRTVAESAPRLLGITEAEAARPLSEGRWSAKEVVGHLIDSAANNHQRFVRGQFRDDLVFDGYEQDEWVRAQAYNAESWPLLVRLWESYNLHLAHVMESAPESVRRERRARHNFKQIGFAPVSEHEPQTLEHLMRDYVGHLKSHLRQILGGD
ncbi:MAG TPA: DinB family protein [Pyrinomonadaceae bacterium]|jgi:hypothetical protein|nr:DinB family protein [Pyrinomonadaceae bacterium]